MEFDFFQNLRRTVSYLLVHYEVDRLGIVRKLLLNEVVAGEPLEWLRSVGYVHLFTASGIHLYVIWDGVATLVFRVGDLFRLSPIILQRLSFVLGFIFWITAWLISDLRAGLVRPLILVGFRTYCRRWGLKPHPLMPLVLSLGFDLGLALFYYAYDLSEFAPGRLHYALAVGGGLMGYEWSRAQGHSSLKMHCSLAWFSWVATAGLDLFSGTVSPLTPILSLLSIPMITLIFYPTLMLGVLSLGAGFQALGQVFLLWPSVILNFLITRSAQFCSQWGMIRSIEIESAWLSFFLGTVISLIVFGFRYQRLYNSKRPPSMTETLPVIHDASSLRRKRMEPAMSLDSPTRPKGNAAPRRA
jgi:hypothetical protein